MANGKKFNPDMFTAASWFYPLGTKVRVTLTSPPELRRNVLVTITDSGPSKELLRDGRIIDLAMHLSGGWLIPTWASSRSWCNH